MDEAGIEEKAQGITRGFGEAEAFGQGKEMQAAHQHRASESEQQKRRYSTGTVAQSAAQPPGCS
jgi:hypothetical protein